VSGRRNLRVLLCGLVALVVAAVWLVLHPVELGIKMTDFALWRGGATSRYTTVDGHRIHYYEETPRARSGTVHATPVVLVHGLGARVEDWVVLMPALARRGYHVYALDLLGYGRSEQPKDATFSIDEEEDVVRGFMDDRGVRQADVVGWSLGGWIAMKLALDTPERVRRVVGLGAAGIYFPPPIPLSDFAPHTVAELRELVNALEPKDKRLPPQVERDALRRMERNAWVVERTEESMVSGKDLLDFRLGGMKQPVLLVWGEADRMTPVATGLRMQSLIQNAQLVAIPKCGHLAPVECGGRVKLPVAAFLGAPSL